MNKRISLYELGLLMNMSRCCMLPAAVARLLFLISGTHFLLLGCSPVLLALMAFERRLSPTRSTVVTLPGCAMPATGMLDLLIYSLTTEGLILLCHPLRNTNAYNLKACCFTAAMTLK